MKFKGKEIKACIFDLDGTLLDSCSIWKEVDERFFEKRGMQVPSDYSKEIGPLGLDKASEYTIKRFNLKEKKEDIINEWLSDVIRCYEEEVELKPYAKEFLDFLNKNNIPMFVATANSRECYEPALKRNGIYEYFDYIENTSSYPKGKKDPAIYLDLSERCGIDPKNIIVFEDIVIGLENAAKAGFITCAIYEKTSQEEDKKKDIADFYCIDYLELLR